MGGAQPFRWCLIQPGELRLKGFQVSLATGRTLIVARVIFLFGFALVVRVIRFILSRETHCKGRRQRENKCQSPSPKAYSACYIYIYTMYLSMCTLFVHNLVTVPKLLLRLFFILFLIFLGFCCFLSVFPQSSALSQSGVAELIHGQFPGGRKIPYTQVNKIDMITIAAESSKDSSQFNKQNANIC